MKRTGIEVLFRKPKVSKPAPGHKIWPRLLWKLPVTLPNQVWAMDITCIPMARDLIYLAAVVDWFTRRVLAGRIPIAPEVDFCIEFEVEALVRHRAPHIFNSVQGSQFTSTHFIETPDQDQRGGQGRGRRDNVFVERPRRTVRHEEVHLRARASVWKARASIGTSIGSATAAAPTRRLTGTPPIGPASTRLRQKWRRRGRGRRPLGKRSGPVRTNRTTSSPSDLSLASRSENCPGRCRPRASFHRRSRCPMLSGPA